ncbi:hypothetical protein A7976_03175 [Methylobacillus sp. MM3]|jgi:hypothetical protein|uniref:DUF6806 family protein n=1 Tax=Methylobacillus sp. MM3 TaxID=1848039 RepID=UPI0007E10103|nr:DUF6806 family protein [Methylobacillus sp. MM3]OAJ70606.1 hypothetical protein A7976_03175 [Methylobacillus sp. MM3]
MRMEVHVHGYIELVEGVSKRQVEGALRPLLQYLDAEHLNEVQSLEPDQPGFAFNDRNYGLEMCCTLEVGRNFFSSLESSMHALGRLVETATAIEVILYHEDGRDETQLMFVGPTPAAILDAQRRRMVEDVSNLLSRHFKQDDVDEVAKLIGDLFRREQGKATPAAPAQEPEDPTTVQIPGEPGRHRLH